MAGVTCTASNSIQSLHAPNADTCSFQNPKTFRTCEPFKFSNATFFRQIVSQNLPHKNIEFSRTVLFVTGGKQKDLVLFDFQENRRVFGKCSYRLLVDMIRSTYAKLAHLNFINERIIELIFKLSVSFFGEVTKFQVGNFIGRRMRVKIALKVVKASKLVQMEFIT